MASEQQMEEIGTDVSKLKPYKLTYGKLEFLPNVTGVPAILEGTTAEPIGICQIAYNEVDDCMYFGYRNSLNDPACAPTGIYRYSFASNKIDLLLEGPNVFGLVVNNTPSKLF